jgi:hypothetical protein
MVWYLSKPSHQSTQYTVGLGHLARFGPAVYLWLFPFHAIGKCTQRYSPSEFEDVDSVVKSIADKTILSNHMLFGDKHNWCDKRTGTSDIASCNNLALLIDSICKKFHERLVCDKILDDGGGYHIILLGKRGWDACMEWVLKEQSTEYSTWMSYQDEQALHK